MQRRATALTSDQIVFKLTHKDDLWALSSKFAFSSLKKAIYIFMEARKKVELMNLKNFLKRWQKSHTKHNSFFGKKNTLTPSLHFPHRWLQKICIVVSKL